MSALDLLPIDTASCPRCGAQIGLGEWTVDLLTQHRRRWLCTAATCGADGTMTLTMTVAPVRQQRSVTPVQRHHRRLAGVAA